MEKLHLVLDWDGVVWDSDSYKRDLSTRLADYSNQPFDELYQNSFDRHGFNDKLLARQIISPDIDFRHALDIVDSRMSSYIYPDAKEFIHEARARRIGRITILSAGNLSFQGLKIDASGIATLLHEVHILPDNRQYPASVAESKSHLLPSLRYDDKSLVFIDNNPDTIGLAQDIYSQDDTIMPIWLNRSSELVDDTPKDPWNRLDIDRLESLLY